jgi:hypothetical protein
MSKYQVSVIGIHQISFSEDLLQTLVCESVGKTPRDMDPGELSARCDMWREQVRDNMQSLYLVELEVRGNLESFDVGAITQDSPQNDSSQTPFDEQWLGIDGREVIGYEPPPGAGFGRLVFWFHFLEVGKPLFGPWGSVALPAPTTMPTRLASLVQYSLP